MPPDQRDAAAGSRSSGLEPLLAHAAARAVPRASQAADGADERAGGQRAYGGCRQDQRRARAPALPREPEPAGAERAGDS
eukprot:5910070-Prymnesium_polylepis.1